VFFSFHDKSFNADSKCVFNSIPYLPSLPEHVAGMERKRVRFVRQIKLKHFGG